MPSDRLSIHLVCGCGLVLGGLIVGLRRARRSAELRGLLAGLDGTAPPLTYQDLVDTDGDPVTEEEFRLITRQGRSEKI